MSNKTPQAVETPKYAWAVLFALYMATLAAPLNMFKLPPVMTTIVAAFDLTASESGDLMSWFSIMGFVLAIPAGFILKRFGIKLTVLFSVGAIVLGTILGALAESARMLFYGRFIEGIGMGLIMVAAPLAISMWFPAHNRALPTGIWATSVGVGNVVTLIAAPSMAVMYGWQSVWWAGAAFAALAFVLFAIIFRMPRNDEMPEAPAPPAVAGKESSPSLFKGMANINYWLIGIGFGVYNLVVMAMCTFLPTFLELKHGYLLTYEKGLFMNASFVTAFIMLASIISAPGGGYISDRLGSRKAVVLVSYAVMTLTFLVPFSITGWQIPVYMLVFGLFGGPIAPTLLATVPEVSKMPQLIGIGMACSALCQNMGMYIGPSLFIRIVGDPLGNGWATAGYWMIPFCIIGMIAVWCIKVNKAR
jgi:MFS family permease